MPQHHWTVCAAVAFSLITAIHAQNPTPDPDNGPSTLKVNARAVIVDVVVTTPDGAPAHGLHPRDFHVLEDGKPQSVVFFEEHAGIRPPVEPLPAMPPHVYTNVPAVPASDAVDILLLDALNTEQQDQTYVRTQVLDFLKNMPPGAPIAILSLTSSLRLVQGFTEDRTLLLNAVQDKKYGIWPDSSIASRSITDDADDRDHISMMQTMAGGHSTAAVAAQQDSQQEFKSTQSVDRSAATAEALQDIARYLAHIPGRKNLIWFAGRFPLTFFPALSPKGTQRSSRSNAESPQQAQQIKDTADLLAVSRVAIYPIGSRGVETITSADAQNWDHKDTLIGADSEQSDITSNYISMRDLAQQTGGEAIINSNDLAQALSKAIDNGSHYYTLSYSPTNKSLDGQLRHIEITIPESQYKLTYRRSYYAVDNTPVIASDPTKPLQALLHQGAPNATQILYGLRVVAADPQPPRGSPHAGANRKLSGKFTRYNVDFLIRWTDLQLDTNADGTHHGRIQVQLVAYDRTGHPLNWAGATQSMNMDEKIFAAVQKSGVPAHAEIDIPDGDAYLATGIYDFGSQKTGSLQIPLSNNTSPQP